MKRYINSEIPLQFMGEELKLETLVKGKLTGNNQAQEYVIRNRSEWGILWDKYDFTPKNAMFYVNFTDEMVVGIVRCQSYDNPIEISKIVEEDSSLKVHVNGETPTSDGLTCPVEFSYHMVKIKKSDKEVSFVYE
jgi:hypothetical protein